MAPKDLRQGPAARRDRTLMEAAGIDETGQRTPVTVECLVEAGDWPDAAMLFTLAARAVEAAWALARPPTRSAGEVSIAFTDDAHIKELNAQWRGKNAATNVLSFPGPPASGPNVAAPGAPALLGDIIVARETLCREAEAEGKTVDDHLSHLIVHGFLHLLGHDHEDDAQAEEMESLERRILHSLAIADPYT